QKHQQHAEMHRGDNDEGAPVFVLLHLLLRRPAVARGGRFGDARHGYGCSGVVTTPMRLICARFTTSMRSMSFCTGKPLCARMTTATSAFASCNAASIDSTCSRVVASPLNCSRSSRSIATVCTALGFTGFFDASLVGT